MSVSDWRLSEPIPRTTMDGTVYYEVSAEPASKWSPCYGVTGEGLTPDDARAHAIRRITDQEDLLRQRAFEIYGGRQR